MNNTHSIKSKDRRADPLTPYFRFPVILQTFSANFKNASYFITSKNSRPVEIQPAQANPQQSLAEYQTFYKQLICNSIDNKEDLGSKELSGFLLNSHWHEYFIKNDKETALLLLEKPDPNALERDEDRIRHTAYNITKGLLPKLEGLIRLISRRNLQMLHSETLNPQYKEMRSFKAVTRESRSKYHVLFPGLLNYLLNVYYSDVKSKGKAPKVPQPDLEPVRTLLKDLICLINVLDLYEDHESDDYQLSFKDVEDQITTLFITLLQQEIRQQSLHTNILFQNPVITYLILFSINTQTGNFKEESLIQNYTSIMIYNFRLFFLGHIRSLSQQEANDDHNLFDFDTTFQTLFKQLLTNTSSNCFEELTQLRAYTHKISSTKFKPGRIIDINANEVEIDSKRIRIDLLSSLFHSVISQLDSLLYTSLLFTTKGDLALDTNKIKDDIFNEKIGFYFADHVNSEQDLTRYKEFLIKKLFDRDSLISKTLVHRVESERLVFNSSAIRELYTQRTRFLELLLVAIYLTSGSPIRGEEILLLRYLNTLTTKNRNILIDSKTNLIRLATTYYKSYNITQAEKTNIRFLCPRLSRVLKTYLLVFIPLYHFLNIYHSNRKEISADLFENKGVRFTVARLTTLLGRESLRSLKERITINPYRHLIKYIIKTRINNLYESDSEEDLIEDIQANHSTKTSDLIYSRDGANQFYHTTISIENRSLAFNLKFFEFFRIGQNFNNKKHTRQTSSVDQGNKRQRAIEYQTFAERLANQELLLPIRQEPASLLDSLKTFIRSKNATFRSTAQEASIQSVLDREPQITYISGTGSGKSLLFFLPFYLHPQWNFFIITPRISLKDDLQQRAKAFGLESEIFSSENAIQQQMVFLSVEDVNSKRFQDHVSSLRARKQEVSFFFDEAHLLVLEEDFRYVLKYIQDDLVHFQQQLVFISATLPDYLLNVLESKFYLASNQVIRGSTTRANITYHIRFLNNQEAHMDVLRLLYQELRAQLVASEKIIIFCPLKRNCEFLSQELDIPCYYSDKEDKELLLKRFQTDPQTNTIIGTTALGVGIDIAHIRFSIHPYKVQSLTALDQEIGRIGRDNQPSASYIIANPRSYSYRPLLSKDINIENAKIIDFNKAVDLVKETQCVRIVLEAYFNHQTITKCNVDACQPCYLCLRKHQITTKALESSRAAQLRRQEAFIALENQLLKLQGLCYHCVLSYNEDGSRSDFYHSLNNCQSNKKRGFTDQVRLLKTHIKSRQLLKAGSCCFQCFLPPQFCYNRNIHEERCIFQDIVLETILLIHLASQRRPALIQPLIITGGFRKQKAFDSQTFCDSRTLPFLAQEIAAHVVYYQSDAIKAIPIISELDIESIIKGYPSPIPARKNAERRQDRDDFNGSIEGAEHEPDSITKRSQNRTRTQADLSEGLLALLQKKENLRE